MAFSLYLLLSIFCLCSNHGIEGAARSVKSNEKILATIDDGFDCVDMYKQPAFKHPLLKNHKIQMRPSFGRNRDEDETYGFGDWSCTPGKVPIRRNKMHHSSNSTQTNKSIPFSPDYFATLDTSLSTTYHGANAMVALYNPQVKADQTSMSLIWVQSGPLSLLNAIQIGWGVNPRLYGDNKTRVTSHWTADGFEKTGCFDLTCPGFVQVHRTYHFGLRVLNISVPGGPQYASHMGIRQDTKTGNRWFSMYDQDVGYWPKSIFTHLANGASHIRFGGFTTRGLHGEAAPMGSGHLPKEGFNTACFFGNIKLVNSKYAEVDLGAPLAEYIVVGDCYDFQEYDVVKQVLPLGAPVETHAAHKSSHYLLLYYCR